MNFRSILTILVACAVFADVGAVADDRSTSSEALDQLLSYTIEGVSPGMTPQQIVEIATANGYTVDRQENVYWQLVKKLPLPSLGRAKIELSASNGATIGLTVSLSSMDGYDYKAEHARLVEHMGFDICENARGMFRCWYPGGKGTGDVKLDVMMDSRSYSMESTDRRD